MGVESDKDRAVFVDPAGFGTVGSYHPKVGPPVSINGVFDDPFSVAGLANGVGIQSTEPRFRVRTADLPALADDGDLVKLPSRVPGAGLTFYRVKELEPDETGDMTFLVLALDVPKG